MNTHENGLKILVCAKRVVDANIKVRVAPDHKNVDIEYSKMSLNPFDETAIEEAVKLKESNIAKEIIAVSIGNEKCIETLRIALARGCDRAILVKTDEYNKNNLNNLTPIMVAKILKQIILKEFPDIILLGKQAIDDDANQVGQMLAGMLNYPQGISISKLDIKNNTATIVREIDEGTEILELKLPAVLTADLHLNQPRFIKLPQLMLAKKKAIEEMSLTDLNVELAPSTKLISVIDGEIKKDCKFINSTNEILKILQNKKVI